MAKKKSWLAVVGVAVAALLTVGLVSALFPQKKPCDHVWDEGKVAVEATCGTNGKQIFTCSDCGEIKTELIKATGDHRRVVCNELDPDFGTCNGCGVNLTDSRYKEVVGDSIPLRNNTWYRYNLINEFYDNRLELSSDLVVDLPGRGTVALTFYATIELSDIGMSTNLFYVDDNWSLPELSDEVPYMDLCLSDYPFTSFRIDTWLYFYISTSDCVIEWETDEDYGAESASVVSCSSLYSDGLFELVG